MSGIIDKKILIKSELFFNQFIVLSTLFHNETDILEHITFPDKSIEDVLIELQELQYIKILGEDYPDIELRKKTYDLFGTTQINFDEFWDEFPEETPSGRTLRPENKLWHGKLTRDYLEAKKKYLVRIKKIVEHQEVIKILKAKNENASRNDKEYENGIIVYINQRKWEKDAKYLTLGTNNNIFIQKV